jgi:hypothetical protein
VVDTLMALFSRSPASLHMDSQEPEAHLDSRLWETLFLPSTSLLTPSGKSHLIYGAQHLFLKKKGLWILSSVLISVRALQVWVEDQGDGEGQSTEEHMEQRLLHLGRTSPSLCLDIEPKVTDLKIYLFPWRAKCGFPSGWNLILKTTNRHKLEFYF